MYADRREIKALLQEVAASGRMVEVAPNLRTGADPCEQFDLFGSLALETGAKCTLSPILHIPALPGQWEKLLGRLDYWRAQGAPLFAQTQVRPLDMNMNLAKGSLLFSKLSTWRQIMDQPVPQRAAMLADPAHRESLRTEIKTMGRTVKAMVVKEVRSAANAPYRGRTVGEIAATEGRPIADVVIELALADQLETEFVLTGMIHADTQVVTRLLTHPGIHVGSADAGAHITSFSGAGDTCYLLDKFVRTEKTMTLQQAVKRITSDLARDWGITDRGAIELGKYADLVIFDPQTIARGPELWVNDLPGGGGRYVRHATGISKVIVNGTLLVDEGEYTGAQPGRLL
jgi:N-acyl-D-aspartate/D-glutamate deacylase